MGQRLSLFVFVLLRSAMVLPSLKTLFTGLCTFQLDKWVCLAVESGGKVVAHTGCGF